MSRFCASNSRSSHSLLVVSLFLVALLLMAPAASAQTWDGSTNSSMKNGGNWAGGTAPATTGADVIFPANPNSGTGSTTPSVDFTSRRTFNTVTFGDDSYSMTGDGFGIAAGMTFNNTVNAITINLTTGTTTDLTASQPWTFNGTGVTWQGALNLSTFTLTSTGSGNLTVGGVVSSGAGGGITKTGSGTLILNGANTYTGGTTISGGKLQAGGTGSATGTGAVAVNSGGTLTGNNTGGRITGTVTVASGGTIAPGTAGAGILKVTAATINAGGTYSAGITGSGGVAGTDYDQIDGAGTVTITGSTLSLNVTITPNSGDSFDIITSANSIVGQFASGTSITAGGHNFLIDYTSNPKKVTLIAVPSANSFLWNGGGGDALWSTGANWVGGTAPTGSSASSDLIFGTSSALQKTNTQPVMGSNTFGSISINTSGYALGGGQTMALNTGLTTSYGSGSSSSSIPTTIAASQTFTIGSGGTFVQTGNVGLNGNLLVTGAGNLTISGNITNSGSSITKSGSGTLTISGAGDTYSGANIYNGGVTLLNSSLSGTVTHTVNAGGTLSGSGNTGSGAVSTAGGTINPGTVGGTGTLTSSAVTMDSAATLGIDTNGNGVNDNYAVGTINFANAALSINHLAAPVANDSWIIVTSSGASSGQLTNGGAPICDSTPFTQNGKQYTVTYPSPTGACGAANGAGNTVLTFNRSNTPPSAVTFTPPSTNEGSLASFTVTFTDPDAADPHTVTVDWGDGSIDGPTSFTSGSTVSHTYLNNPGPHPSASGTYSIAVTIADSGNATATNTKSITINNVTPNTIVITPSPSPVNEGDATFSISGSFSDGSPTASSDDHAMHIQWGDGQTTDVGTFSAGTGLGAGVTTFGPISHTYTDLTPSGASSRSETITVQVKDMDSTTGSNTQSITVNNVAPTLVSAPATLVPASNCTFDFVLFTANCPIRVVATWTDPGTEGSTYTVNVTYLDATNATLTTASASNVASPATIDHNATISFFNLPYNICTTVTDHNTGVSNQVCSPFTFNTPPVNTKITSLTPNPSNEGDLVTLNGSFDDPNNGTPEVHTITVRWGDGSADETFATPAAQGNGLTFSRTHTYKDNGSYNVQIISNLDASSAADPGLPSAATVQVVNNVAPTLNTVAATSINENGTTTLSGNIVDPGVLDTFTLHIDWGDGASQDIPLAAATTSFSQQHQYLDNPGPHPSASGNYNISVTVTDKDGGVGSASPTANVSNLAPVLGAVNVTNGLFPGDVTSLSGTITDVGTLDSHTVVINWGDGGPTTSIPLAAGVTTFNPTHNYALGGNYVITVNATDDDAAAATAVGGAAVVPDFALSAPTSSAAVVAGQTAPFTIRVSQLFGPFTQPVALTCSGNPAGTNCSFAGNNVTPGATFVDSNLSITTTLAGLGQPPIPDQSAPFYAKLFSYGGFGLAGFVLMAGSRRKNRKLFMSGMLLLVLGLVIFLPGCGASGAGTTLHLNATGANSATPKGTYTITVTGTFSGPPVTAHSTTITLTVN